MIVDPEISRGLRRTTRQYARVWGAAIEAAIFMADAGGNWKDRLRKSNPYLDSCDECGRSLRPYGSSVGEYPMTVARQSSNPPLCEACSQRRKRGKKYVPLVEREKNDVVRRLVRDRHPEAADEILKALGLGDR